MPETKTFIIWNHEAYFGSPAYKSVFISWIGELYEAKFYLDVDPAQPPIYGCVNKFAVNEYEITNVDDYGDPCDVMTFPIPPDALKNNDSNEFRFYFNPVPIPGVQSGGAYGKLTLTADKVITAGEIPSWWWIAALGLGAVGVIGVVGAIIYEERRRQEMLMLMLARRK